MVRVTPSKVLKLVGLLILLSAAAVLISTSIGIKKVEPAASSAALVSRPPLRSDHGLGNDDSELFTFVQVLHLKFILFCFRLRT